MLIVHGLFGESHTDIANLLAELAKTVPMAWFLRQDFNLVGETDIIIGFGKYGYAAAKYQEDHPEVTVIAISSPEVMNDVLLKPRTGTGRCLAICQDDQEGWWKMITPDTYGLLGINDDLNQNKQFLCWIITTFLGRENIKLALDILESPLNGDSADDSSV